MANIEATAATPPPACPASEEDSAPELSYFERLEPDIVAMIARRAGPHAVVAMEMTSKSIRALMPDHVIWAAFVQDLWSTPPFSTATRSLARGRVKGWRRPAIGPNGYKGAYRKSLQDALTFEELTSRPWYHTWSAPYRHSGAPCRYRLARCGSVVGTSPVVRAVTFNADGSMTWHDDGRLSDGTPRPGSHWRFVERGSMQITPPGSVIQYKHLLDWPIPRPQPTECRFPALRVYRVACRGQLGSETVDAPPPTQGWVLRSQYDTFTSFRRDGDGVNLDAVVPVEVWLEEEEEVEEEVLNQEVEEAPRMTTLTWRLENLRRHRVKADCRIGDECDDDEWLAAEGDAFVADFRHVMRGDRSQLQFGDCIGNQFTRR